jgi:hypothetical protein
VATTIKKGNAPGGQLPDDEWERHERRRRRSRRWQERDPLGRESSSGISEEENDALDGLTPSERARAERIIADSNAWRTDMPSVMRQDFFEYEPQLKLIVAGNQRPGLCTVNEAIRRRFNLVPFTVTIPPVERDKDLAEKLKAEWWPG